MMYNGADAFVWEKSKGRVEVCAVCHTYLARRRPRMCPQCFTYAHETCIDPDHLRPYTNYLKRCRNCEADD